MNNLDRYLNKITQGDSLDLLKELPDESVHCVVTSPPYWGLRSYAHDSHIWDGDPNCEHDFSIETKAGDIRFRKGSFCIKCNAWKGQLGLEPTFKLYIQHLLDIFKEIKRVLKKTGTCWVNIGDRYCSHTFGSSTKAGGLQKKLCQEADAFPRWINKTNAIQDKCQISIPERFKIAMTDELGFVCRNTIIWKKPNCMPASVSDRFTVDFEFLYFFTVSPKYYFEQQFEPHINFTKPVLKYKNSVKNANSDNPTYKGFLKHDTYPRPEGRNKRCVWAITTKGFPDAHFATFPEALIEIPIKAGCPEGGIVLDPFAGSGTTALVALKHNRQHIGFEISQAYVDMANKRLKPYREQGKIFKG